MKIFDKHFLISTLTLLAAFIVVLILPIYFIKPSSIGINFSNTGQIGDTFSGITGPFIAIGAAYLTFIAFWVQYKANSIHRLDIEKERFERKYYELIRIHRENINDMNIANRIYGRKCFVNYYNELKFIYLSIKQYNNKEYISKLYSPEELLNLSFILFYNGIGFNSNIRVNQLIESEDLPIIELCREFLENIKNQVRNSLKTNSSHKVAIDNKESDDPNLQLFEFKIAYVPFDGHSTRIGHYIRHLFQSVKFVVNQPESLLSLDEKLSFLKTLRAQLSDHEQLLIYYNSFFMFGIEWQTNEYLTTYRMINNLPLAYADFGVRPMDRFGKEIDELKSKGKTLFEWQDILITNT